MRLNPRAARTPERAAAGSPCAATPGAGPGSVRTMPSTMTSRHPPLPSAASSPRWSRRSPRDGGLDLDAAQRVATHLVDHGHDGLVISGTTGESPTTSDAEKERLSAPSWRPSATGPAWWPAPAPTTPHIRVELARSAAKAGAHGAARCHPVLLQAAAGRADRAFHCARRRDRPAGDAVRHPRSFRHPDPYRALVRLAEHPRIVAVKDAKDNLYEGSWVLAGPIWSSTPGRSAQPGLAGPRRVRGGQRRRARRPGPDTPTGGRGRRAETCSPPAACIRPATGRPGDHDRSPKARSWPRRRSSCKASSASRRIRLPLVEATDAEVDLLRADLDQAGRSGSHPHPELGPPPCCPRAACGSSRSVVSARSAAIWPSSNSTASC